MILDSNKNSTLKKVKKIHFIFFIIVPKLK